MAGGAIKSLLVGAGTGLFLAIRSKSSLTIEISLSEWRLIVKMKDFLKYTEFTKYLELLSLSRDEPSFESPAPSGPSLSLATSFHRKLSSCSIHWENPFL